MLEHSTPQRPPAPGTAAPRGPERASHIRVERLEYGKFCVSPEGRIEDMAEYRQLGWTEEFPQWLVNSCAPSVIGISSDAFAFDSTLGGPEYGTVLRPVVPPARPPVSVMCRVRTRPEGGEGQEGRRYTVARYIASQAADLDPRELLSAMDSEPLQGVTHQDLAPRLSPLWAEPQPLPDDGALSNFLRDALVYILSGVPVAVTEACGEDCQKRATTCEAQFFAWVAAVWHALPRGLRPYLSAGWGVGGQLSGSLAVTYATRPSDTCAAFGHKSGRWATPAKVLVREGGELRKKDFSSEPYRLTAGRVYVECVLGWAPGVRPRLAELRAAADAWPLSDRLPVYEFQPRPDWPDAENARAFRYPGLKRFDDDRADDICRWIERGVTRDGAAPSPDARGLLYTENRLRVFARAVAAQAEQDGKPRGDAVVWASLKGERAPDFVEHVRGESKSSGAGATRARLMLAVREGSVADALHWLLKSAPDGAADDLPEEAEAGLHELLGADESLSHAGNLSLHLNLLRHPRCPGPYLGWLRAQPFGLSLTLLTAREEGVTDCAHILKLTDAPSARALLNLARRRLPTAEDHAALAALDEGDKLKFTRSLLNRWFMLRNRATQRGIVRKHRELILQWLDGLPLPGETEDALLRLWRGQSLTRHHLHAIKDEVEGLIVPPAPLPLIADLVRHNFFEFADHVKSRPDAWAPVASYILPKVAHALLMKREDSQEGEARANSMPDAREVRMRVNQANDLIMYWTDAGRRELRSVADLLWQWAVEALPTNAGYTTAADLCRYLDRAELPSELKRPGEETLDALLLLAEVLGKDKELLPESQKLWEQAKRGWQLRLLMEMFPDEDLAPTLRQLGKLVSHQKWLRAHLRRTTIHPDRREHYELATVSFLGLTFPGTGEFPWHKELSSETVLWAAYHGIPFKHQGSLREALDAYGEDLQERAELCLKYVRSYKHDDDDYKEALSHALADFLLPEFGDAGMNTKEMASALRRGEGGGWFGGGILLLGRSSYRRSNYDAALDGVVNEVIMGLDGKDIEKAIKAFRQKHKR